MKGRLFFRGPNYFQSESLVIFVIFVILLHVLAVLQAPGDLVLKPQVPHAPASCFCACRKQVQLTEYWNANCSRWRLKSNGQKNPTSWGLGAHDHLVPECTYENFFLPSWCELII